MAAPENLISNHLLVDGTNDRLEVRDNRSVRHQPVELNQGHRPITILALQRFAPVGRGLAFETEDHVGKLNEISVAQKRFDWNPLTIEERTIGAP